MWTFLGLVQFRKNELDINFTLVYNTSFLYVLQVQKRISKCKQDSVGVRRILVVPRDSGGASAGFCWCIWGEMADEVVAPRKSTTTEGRAALRMR